MPQNPFRTYEIQSPKTKKTYEFQWDKPGDPTPDIYQSVLDGFEPSTTQKTGFLGRAKEAATGLFDTIKKVGPLAASLASGNTSIAASQLINNKEAKDTIASPFKHAVEDPTTILDSVGLPVHNLKQDYENKDYGAGAFDLGMTALTLLGAKKLFKGKGKTPLETPQDSAAARPLGKAAPDVLQSKPALDLPVELATKEKVITPGSLKVNLDPTKDPFHDYRPENPFDPKGEIQTPKIKIKAERSQAVKEALAEKLTNNPNVTPSQIKQVESTLSKWKGATYDKVAKSVSSQIKDLGGEELAKTLNDTETEAASYGGKFATEIRKVNRNLSPAEKTEVIKVLDGKIPYAQVTNPKVANAYQSLRTVLNQLGTDAEKSGMNLSTRNGSVPFKMMEGEYFPHQYPEGFWKDKPNLVNELIKQGKSPETAQQIVDNAHVYGEKFLAPQHARELNLPGYIEDTSVLERYAYDMGRKIKIAEKLGNKDIADPNSPISQMIAKTNDPQKVTSLLTNYFNRGDIGDPTSKAVSNAITKAEVASHLSMFAINNLNDLATIPLRSGVKNFTKAAWDTLKDPHVAGDKASDSGAYAILRKEALKDVDSGDLLSKAYGIAPVEKTIRTIGALAGRASVQDLFTKAKTTGNKTYLARLQDLVKEPVSEVIKQSELTPEQIDFAGGRAVELTSGVPNKLQLPPAFTEGNPLLRLPLLFKRFAFINTKNLVNVIKNEPTTAGKVAKATAALAAYQLAGEVTGDLKAGVKSLITGHNEIAKRGDNSIVDTGNETIDRIMANFMQSFFFGLVGDVASGLSYGGKGFYNLIGGPVASDAAEFIDASKTALSGYKDKSKTMNGRKVTVPSDSDKLLPLKKSIARRVPFIGSGLAARLNEKEKKVKPNFGGSFR